MAGIDKEKREINRDVLAYGIILSILYMIYLYIIEKNSIYRYIIYLVLYVIILLVDNITLKKKYAKKIIHNIIITSSNNNGNNNRGICSL